MTFRELLQRWPGNAGYGGHLVGERPYGLVINLADSPMRAVTSPNDIAEGHHLLWDAKAPASDRLSITSGWYCSAPVIGLVLGIVIPALRDCFRTRRTDSESSKEVCHDFRNVDIYVTHLPGEVNLCGLPPSVASCRLPSSASPTSWAASSQAHLPRASGANTFSPSCTARARC